MEGKALRCWDEGQESCFHEGRCPGTLLPFEKLVLMSYSPASGRYEWKDAFTGAPLEAPAVGYRPSQLVERRRLEPWIERWLFGPWRLARFLPVFADDAAHSPARDALR